MEFIGSHISGHCEAEIYEDLSVKSQVMRTGFWYSCKAVAHLLQTPQHGFLCVPRSNGMVFLRRHIAEDVPRQSLG